MDEDLLKMDGFDDAIIGVCYSGVEAPKLVYSREAMAQILVMYHDMSLEDAEEYVSYNCEGAYVGPSTPLIMWPYREDFVQPNIRRVGADD